MLKTSFCTRNTAVLVLLLPELGEMAVVGFVYNFSEIIMFILINVRIINYILYNNIP